MRVAITLLIVLRVSAAYADDACGDPPINTSNTNAYTSAYTELACSEWNLEAGATIPIAELPLPISANASGGSKKCSSKSGNTQSLIKSVRSHLTTDATLAIAECGYRMCKLQESGGDSRALDLLRSVCLNSGPQGDNVRLETNYFRKEWSNPTSGNKSTSINITIINENDNDVSIQAKTLNNAHFNFEPSRVRISRKDRADIIASIPVPTVPPEVDKPYRFVFYIEYRNRRLPVALEISAPRVRGCLRYEGNSCVECKSSASFSGIAGGGSDDRAGDLPIPPACERMTQGPYDATIEYDVKSVGEFYGSSDVWLELQATGSDGITIHSPGAVKIPTQQMQLKSRAVVGNDGRAKLKRLRFYRCQTGRGTTCTGSISVIFSKAN